jgi:hypothetical protein
MFKITWGWGNRKTFPTWREMMAWIEAHADEVEGGMFSVKRYVKGADNEWYPLGED